MAMTNSETARAATETASGLNRPLTLLGIFTSPEGARALVRKDGASVMLQEDIPQEGLTLMGTGDGWAMVQYGDSLHRLVIG